MGNIDLLPKAQRVILLVHAAQGTIDNGGLQYFFENDFPGLPPYAEFADAYREIGAEDVAAVIESAVALFGFDDPHLFQADRIAFMEVHGEELFDDLDQAICGREEVWAHVDAYAQAQCPTLTDAEFSD